MNPQKSVLQQQYPLSPRKFWKKMIMGLYVWYILIGIAIVTISVIYFFNNSDSLGGKAYAGLLVSSLLFLIPLVIITLPYAWYIKVYIRRYYYDGEENFITIKKGVFAPGEIHVQWQKIQDVYVDQDILDRIMGLYDVHIASATITSGIEAHIDGVDQAAAEGLKKFLLDKVSNAGRNNFQGNIGAQPTNPVEPPKPTLTKINLSEDISSNTYPLLGKWTVLTLFSRLVSSFIFPAFIFFVFFGRLDDIITADYWIYLVLGWLALGILTMIIRTVTLFLWIKNYAFNFTPEHIYYREGVISMSEKHMPYSSIQDVTVKQGIIERLFGLAKVVIQNAAQQPMMVGRRGERIVGFSGVIIQGLSLGDANKITNILKTTVLGRNTSHYGL